MHSCVIPEDTTHNQTKKKNRTKIEHSIERVYGRFSEMEKANRKLTPVWLKKNLH